MAKIYLLSIFVPSADSKSLIELKKMYLDTKGSTVKATLKALPHHSYRLVDAQTMALIKDQYVIRKGKQLQVWVDEQIVVELDDFFEISEQSQLTNAELPSYVVQQGSADSPTYGLINAHTPLQYIADQTSVVWAPGVQLDLAVDPVALGFNPAALSSMFSGTVLSTGAAAVGIATLALSESNDSKSSSETSSTLRGSVSLGTLISSSLTITAYKSDGTKLQETAVNDDGSYTFTLNGYTGPLMLMLSGTATYNNESGGTATFDASVTTLRAVVNAVAGSLSAHLNPLTEIAAKKLVVTDSKGNTTLPSTATIAAMNSAISKLFLGESKDVTQVEADTTTDGGTTSNNLGRFLAIVAAAEQKDELTTQQVIDKLVAGINTEGNAFSGDEAKNLLLSAAAQAVSNDSLQSDDVRALLKTIFLDSTPKAAPQVLITADKGMLGMGATCTVTFTFNQDPVGSFDLADVTVSGGVLSNLVVSANDALVYTAKFTPTPGGTAASIRISADTFTAGTPLVNNIPSDTLTLLVDTLAPAVPNASLRVDSSNGNSGLDADRITNLGAITAPNNIEKGATLAYRVKKSVGNFSDWSSTYNAPATDGSADDDYTIEVRQTDKFGNVSSTQTISFTLDSTKPSTPNAVLSTDSSNGLDASYASDGITNSGALTAPTNTEVGALLEYRIQKASDAFSDWSTTYTVPTSDGSYAVEVRQTDKAGNVSSTQTINFTIDKTAPSLATTAINLNENNTANALVSSLQASDASGSVTFSTVLQGADATKFSIDAQGNLRVRDTKNFESKDDANGDGVYALTVSGTDVAGNSFTQDITVTLNNLNEAPVLVQALANQTFLAGGSTNSFTVPANSFTDPDRADTLTYSATLSDGSELPSWLTFDAASRTFSGSSSTNGSITVKVTATDSASTPLSTSANFVITSVLPPTVSSFKVTDNNAAGGSNNAVGKQGDTLSIALTMSEAVTVNSSPTISVKVGGTDVTATYSSGSDSNVLLFTALAPAGSGSFVQFNGFDVNGGSVIGNTSGQAWATATVADASYSLDNLAPVWGSSSLAATEGLSSDITSDVLAISDNLATGANLKFTGTSSRGNLQVNGVNRSTFTLQDVTDGKVKFVHDGGETAPTLTLTASDGVNTASQTLVITFTNVDDAPVINSPLTLTLNEGGDVALVVPTNAVTDVDSTDANVTLQVSNLSSNGRFYLLSDSTKTAITSFSLADAKAGNIKYLHDGSETAPTFSITAKSGTAVSNTMAGVVRFTPVDDAPTAINLSNIVSSLPENSDSSSNIKLADIAIADVDGGTNNITLSGTDAASFLVSGNVLYLKTGTALNFENKPRYSVTLNTGSVTQTFSLDVSDINEAPVVSNPLVDQIWLVNRSGSFTIPTNRFTDPDAGSTLSYTATLSDGSALPSWLTFDAASRTFSGTPTANTSVNVKVTATDNGAGNLSVSDDFTLTAATPSTLSSFTVTNNNAGGGSNNAVGKQGDTLTFALTMSEAVTVSGAPTISVTLGGSTLTANYASGSDSNVLLFTATAPAGDSSTVSFNSFSLNGGSVIGNTSGVAWATSSVPAASYSLDNTVPVWSSSSLAVTEGLSSDITSDVLAISDNLATGANLKFTGTSSRGNLQVNGVNSSTFTLQDVTDGKVKFVHDGGETAPTLTLTASDGVNTASQTLTISFTNVDDAPVINSALTLTLNEGGDVALVVVPTNAVTDVDSTDANVTLQVSNLSSSGKFYSTSDPTKTAITSFSLANAKAGNIKYLHDGSETAPTFSITAISGTASSDTVAGVVRFTPVDDAPVMSPILVITEGQSLTLTRDMLGITDPDTTDVNLTITATLQTNGNFTLNNSFANSFTLDDVVNGKVKFVHDGSESAPGIRLKVTDRSNIARAVDVPVTVSFTNTQDPTVLQTPSFAISEGGSLLLNTSHIPLSDPDTQAEKIQLLLSNVAGGRFEKVSASGIVIQSFLLSELQQGQIRFVHDGSETQPSFAVSAINLDDNSTTASVNSNLLFNRVNDLPSISSPSLTISQGTPLLVTLAMLGITDPDNTNAEVKVTVNSYTNGSFRFNNGSTPVTSFTLKQVADNAITVVDDGTGIKPVFSISVTDQSNTVVGPVGVRVNLNTSGNNPPLVDLSNIVVQDGQELALTSAILKISDVDTPANLLNITVSNLNGVTFKKDGTAQNSFTLQDVIEGKMKLSFDSSTAAPKFDIKVTDNAPQSVTVSNVVLVVTNKPPQIGTPQLEVTEGMSVVLTQDMLAVYSADNSAADVTINVSNVVGGYFSKTGSVDILTNFTLADIQASRIQFTHDGSETAPLFDLNANNPIGRTSASVRATPVLTRVNDAPQFISGFPNNRATVDENSSGVVFTAPLANDVDGPTLSYQLSGVDKDRFFIDASRNIRFLTAPDFEVPTDSDGNNSYLLNIDATDGSLKATQSLVVYVGNVNDAPRIASPGFALVERGSATLTKAALGISDQDTPDTSLTVTTSNISGGSLKVNGQSANTFTVSQLTAGLVTFAHDGLSSTPTLSLKVSDGVTTTAVTPVTISYTTIDDAPLVNSMSLSVQQGATLTITPQMFNVTDGDTLANNVVFNLSGVQGGVFKLSGSASTRFTLADIAANSVQFVHDGTGTPPAITYTVGDSTNTLTPQTFTGTLSLTNVKPLVLPAVFSLTETADIASVTLTKSMLGISDQDNTDDQVTIQASSLSGGYFQKSGVTVTTFTLAEVAAGSISFKHLYGTGSPTFSLQAKDTSGNDYATAVASTATLVNAPYNLIMGDGSGSGGKGVRYSGYAGIAGVSAVTDNDTLTGSVRVDVIFGDGSGGGAGGSVSNSTYVAGGNAGSGADQINANGGDDIVFGDGFAAYGQAGSGTGTDGGYGGGGGGGTNSGGRVANKGGFGGGLGGVGSTSNTTSQGGSTTIHNASVADALGGFGESGGGIFSGGGGAGVGNATTNVIANALSQTQYDIVYRDVSRASGADVRVFNQAMGTGADSIDAGDGNDWVLAGGGNDSITGGKGNDRVFTGFGADTVVYKLADLDGSTDTIADFNPTAGDKLQFGFIPADSVKQYLNLQAWGNGQRLLVDKDGLGEFDSPEQVIDIGYASTANISTVTNGAAYAITINYKNATNVSQTKTYPRTANTPSASLAATDRTEIMQSLVTQINADASLTNTYATFEGGTFQFARLDPSNTQTQPVISFSSTITPVVSPLNNSTQPDAVTLNALLTSGAITLDGTPLPVLSPELIVVEGQSVPINSASMGFKSTDSSSTQIQVRNVQNGYFALSGTTTPITSFTIAQLASMVFVHDGSELSPQFEMSSDVLTPGTLSSNYLAANINFQKVNDAPVFQNSRTSKIINVGESLRLTEADLGTVVDPDTAADSLILSVSLPSTYLKFVNADTGDLSVTNFSLADVKNNKISLSANSSTPLATYLAAVSCADGQGGTANMNLSVAVDMPGRQKAYIKSLVVIMNSMNPQVMTTDDLKIVSPDSNANDLVINVDASSGLKFLSTSTLTEINQFTYQDVIDGTVSIQRKTGSLPIDSSLVRLRLEDKSDTTLLTNYYDAIVYVGEKSILYADASSAGVTVPAGSTTTLSWGAMGMRLKTALIGTPSISNLYDNTNSIGQQVGNTVFLSNAANPSNPFTLPFNLTPIPNVAWGTLDFSSPSTGRYGWAGNRMLVKYIVDQAQADAPFVMSSGFTAIRGQTSLMTPSDLDIRDADSAASQIIINTRNVKNGRIELVSAPNLAVNKFTMQDVFDGKVLFRHDGSNMSPSFELAVTNPNMHNGVNLYFNKAQGRLITNGVNLAPNPDWLNLIESLFSKYLDLDTSPENVTVSLSNIQGMSGYNSSSSPFVFTWRDFTERTYFRNVQESTNGAQMLATVNDGNTSVSSQITVSTGYESQSDRVFSATMYLNEEGGRNLVNPALFKYTKISQVQLANFNVDSIFGMRLELLSNPGVSITTFSYRQLDGGQLVAVYDGGDVLPQLSLSINQSFAALGYSGSYVSPSRSVNVVLDRISKDDAPMFNPSISIGAGQSRVLYAREFNVVDAESYASADYSGLIFKIKETEGIRIERSGTPGNTLTQFTYSELDQGLINIVSLNTAYPVLRMSISNPDGSSESQTVDTSFAYQKGVINDAPVFSIVASPAIDQGGSLLITEQMLGINDVDSSRNKVTLTNTGSTNGVFKIADHIASSFTLSQIKSGLVSFVHDGSSTAPVMKLTAADETTNNIAQNISLTVNPLASPANPNMGETSGALIIFGDGSGSGGSGARFTGISPSRTGLNGAGDNDTLTGSAQADVIFGDGSGGGEGAASSGVGIGGGSAGSGNDAINAGGGNDIIFGDGFWGDNCSQYEIPASGGYGGGGGGGMWLPSPNAGLGGIGAGHGKSYNGADINLSVGAASTLFNSGGSAQPGLSGLWGGGGPSGYYSGGGGAGVNTRALGDTTNTSTTSVIQTSLSDAMYLKVFNDVTGGPGADLRVFNQAMGSGNDLIDAGAGNDWVLAGGGNDTITGGTGSDVVWGGLGADTFKFNLTDFAGSNDVIKDFSKSQNDQLLFTGMTLSTVDQYVKLVSDVSANKTTLLIDTSGTGNFLSTTNTIVLENSIEFQTMAQLKNAMAFVV